MLVTEWGLAERMGVMSQQRREHWERVYATKGDAELSWFQAKPEVSLGLIDGLGERPRRVVDVGGGQSLLAGELLDRGVEEVAVVDVSGAALARARERLGARGARVKWVEADVLEVGDLGKVDLWHDRAVFHFLTDAEERRRYAGAMARAVEVGGRAIVATFALDGPEKCSGLPVCRFDAAGLGRAFAPEFVVEGFAEEAHATPWGKVQKFVYVVMRRGGG